MSALDDIHTPWSGLSDTQLLDMAGELLKAYDDMVAARTDPFVSTITDPLLTKAQIVVAAAHVQALRDSKVTVSVEDKPWRVACCGVEYGAPHEPGCYLGTTPR